MANATGNHVATRFKLTAEITTESGLVTFDDIVACSATFGLNSIPTATLIVASGQDYTRIGDEGLASIHKHIDKLRPRDKIIVRLEIINGGGDKQMMEDGKYVIFDGYLAGIGHQRAYDSCSYTLHLLHWLDDLNNSSMINGDWFPGAPTDLAQTASYTIVDSPLGGGGAGARANVPVIDPRGQLINIGNVTKDLWGSVFQPILKGIANLPAPTYQANARQKNDAALKALDRMPPEGAKGKEFYTPLGLDLGGGGSPNVAKAIQQIINHNAGASFAYTTFWSKLVGEYAPQFYFAISPSVEYALAVPFFAGLDTPFVEIDSTEYGFSRFDANMSQIIESVDVFFPAPSDTGLIRGGEIKPAASFRLPFGFYPPQNKQNKRGMKLLKEPPGWLTNLAPFSSFAAQTSGVQGQPIGDGSKSRTGTPGIPLGYDDVEAALDKIKKGEVPTKFAEHWYKTEVLYQRHGELSGKLRFDISPGSIIKVNTPPYDRQFVKHHSLFATVTQVSYVINAEKASAGTSFVLAHIRTEEENDDTVYFTSDKPPLYKTAWSGSKLALKG